MDYVARHSVSNLLQKFQIGDPGFAEDARQRLIRTTTNELLSQIHAELYNLRTYPEVQPVQAPREVVIDGETYYTAEQCMAYA